MMTLPIYLDYAATTPVDPRVLEAMLPYLSPDQGFANPASTNHLHGVAAREAVEAARKQVANTIGAEAREVIWTSGATEANNLALKGAMHFYQRRGRHLITVKTEHRSVLDACDALADEGFEITYLEVNEKGFIDLESLTEAIQPETVLISIMHVNNELGVIQPIQAIAKLARQYGILTHVDASQSIGKIQVDVAELDVDLMSLSAHKAYGPKGIGALYVRQRVRLKPLLHGGGHERGLRSGTLPTHQIVGMGCAFELSQKQLEVDAKRYQSYYDQFLDGLKNLEAVSVNAEMADNTQNVSSIINVCFHYVEGEALLMALHELAVSTGSACSSAHLETSHVLHAIGLTEEEAYSSIRFSWGRFTTDEEITRSMALIQKHVQKLRAMSPIWESYVAEQGQ